MYSKSAKPQLNRIAISKGAFLYLRWPYQAIVMKILETISKAMVFIEPPVKCSTRCLKSKVQRLSMDVGLWTLDFGQLLQMSKYIANSSGCGRIRSGVISLSRL